MKNDLHRLEAEMYEANRVVRSLAKAPDVDPSSGEWRSALAKADKAKRLFENAKAAASVPRCPTCGQTL